MIRYCSSLLLKKVYHFKIYIMKKLRRCILLIGCLIFCVSVFAQIQITLRKSFIDSIKNKVTITTDYFVDIAPSKPHSAADDGDMHVAGRSDVIGLPIVAEIMNAKSTPRSVSLVHSVEGTD